jgi:hypothetical protein
MLAGLRRRGPGPITVGVVAVILSVGLTACENTPEGSPDPSTNPTSNAPSVPGAGGPATEIFALDDCPIQDRGFCEVGVVTVNAIVAGDAEALVGVSRPREYDCGGIVREIFPGCETAEVLNGYLFSTGSYPTTMTVDVLSQGEYLDRLQRLFASVDAGYEDTDGDGGPSVIGIKKCGGSWTVAWTAAVRDGDEPAERTGAFFEFVTSGPDTDDWYTEGSVLVPLRAPGFPAAGVSLDQVGCGGTTMIWPSAA